MIIGITGGVGAGKSTVLQILEEKFGAHLLIADTIVRDLMMPGGTAYRAVVDYFGEEILASGADADGSCPIDRAKLASIVFAEEEKLAALNQLTHPLGRQFIEEQIRSLQENDPQCLIVIEAALLFESGYNELCDEVWAVITDPECRYERLSASRGYSREKTDSVMANQKSDAEFAALSDRVISNSKDLSDTEGQIAALLENR